MKIDITTADLLGRYGVYRTDLLHRLAFKRRFKEQKKFLLDQFVKKKAILGPIVVGEEENNAPVDMELLRRMVRAACVSVGGIISVHTPGTSHGTSHACAKFVLNNSVGGIMFRNCKDESGIYWKGVARAIGVPDNVYENDGGWRLMLAKAVAAAADIKPQSTWWDIFLEMCGGAKESDDDMPFPPFAEGAMMPRGILIFDDFNNIQHEEDVRFMTVFFEVLRELRILAFLLVSDKETADRVAADGERVTPLERHFPEADTTCEVLDEIISPLLERAKEMTL